MVNTTGILGALIFARHADRIESFSSPSSYATYNTLITPLGTHDAFASGTYLRNTYIDPHSGSPTLIPGIAPHVADINQLLVRADSSGDGQVFLQSATAVVQGLYPPTSAYEITLADGQRVQGSLGGYQFIPMNAVDMNVDVSLNGLLSCPNFDAHVAALENSTLFHQKAQKAHPFLEKLQPYLGGRPIDFSLMMWDFVDVQSQHNATYLHQVPKGYVNQARVLADFHDGYVYSDPRPDGIGNVGTRVMLPAMFSALTRIANASDPLKLAFNGISYKPFISLFNLTEAIVANPEVRGIENYNSLASIEVHGGNPEPTVNLRFKNGTADVFHPLKMFGQDHVPLSEFISKLAPSAINSTAEWCAACNQTTLRGCSAFS
uniref:Phosphoglycerate mutase-like protein n=1 Tax=Mycena chlorophos TaxID=658473 RepID=A0ABQ0M470_MYCCL|nr:predicted protein [Mycena chlorophos]